MEKQNYNYGRDLSQKEQEYLKKINNEKLVNRNNRENNNSVLITVSVLALFSIIGCSVSGCDSSDKERAISKKDAQINTLNKKNQELESQIAEMKKNDDKDDDVSEEVVIESKNNLYNVVEVIDGDTIKVKIEEKVESIRIIGIDTPEKVDPRKSVECFAKEASKEAKDLLIGQKVYLEEDESQGNRDKYDRLLRHVFLEGNINFGKHMIKEGYASEHTYNLPYKYQDEFKEAEQSARESKKGLWADGICEEDVIENISSQNINVAPSALTETAIKSVSGSSYVCDCSKTCKNMGCAEAQFQLNACDCTERDGNDDGIACNAQCR